MTLPEHNLEDTSFFTEQFNAALQVGGIINLPADMWRVVNTPIVAPGDKFTVIKGNGSTLRQGFPKASGAIFQSQQHPTSVWATRLLRMKDLTVWGERGDTPEGASVAADGLDLINVNQGYFKRVRAVRCDKGFRWRTNGATGQMEHNTLWAPSWTECSTGMSYEVNPAGGGGHKGQKVYHALGSETFVHISTQPGSNIYTSTFKDFHFWHSKALPWSIGLWFGGKIHGIRSRGSMEVAWPDRFDTVMLPVVIGTAAEGAHHNWGSDIFLTNNADGAFSVPPLMDQRPVGSPAITNWKFLSSPY